MSFTAEYHFERLSDKNIVHLVTLYRNVFKRKISEKFLLEKYDTHSQGVMYLGFIALTKHNTPAAYYGVIPQWMTMGGKKVLAAQSADTMTHEEHRNKGLFLHLANMTYALAKEHNVQFIFGFPNQNSLRGFEKLGWRFVQNPLTIYAIKIRAFPLSKVMFKSAWLGQVYQSIVRRLVGRKKERFYHIPDFGLLRNEEFVHYKQYNRPFFTSINGIKVWLRIDRVVRIGLVDPENLSDASQLIPKLKRFALLMGCNEFILGTQQGSSLFRLLAPIEPVGSLAVGFYSLHTAWDNDFEKIIFEYCDVDIF